jgi:hypothetical protein
MPKNNIDKMLRNFMLSRLYSIFGLFLVVITLILTYCLKLSAGEDIIVPKSFTQFTSKNLEGFLKPAFTTLEQSLNSSFFTFANFEEHWSFAIDISAMGMFIPDAQKAYDAELPQYYDQYDYIKTSENQNGALKTNFGLRTSQPSIYGGTSTPVFAAPRSHYSSHLYTMPNGETISLADTLMFKTISFVEGNQISFMSGLPAIQLIFGMPTYSEVRFRCFFLPVQGETLSYLGIIASQRIDNWFDWFKNDPLTGLAVNFSYHNISRTKSININSWSAGAHFSKGWESGLTAFCGFQYEDMRGSLTLTRTAIMPGEQIDNPYPEIRFNEPLNINIGTFTNYRLLGGLSYRYSFLEIHADAAIASQPILTAGVTFWIAQFGKEKNTNNKNVK